LLPPQFLNQSAPLSVSAEAAMQKTSVPTQMMKVYNLITLSDLPFINRVPPLFVISKILIFFHFFIF